MSHTRIVTSLNGMWKLEPGDADSPPASFHHTIPVPGLIDLADPRIEWDASDNHWYQTEFTLDEKDIRGRVFLKIEQASFGTGVRLNGNHVGSSIACYTSQEYDLTDYIRYGKPNVLSIRVGAKRTLPPESAVGNDYEKTDFIPGIWGDVYLIQTGTQRIKYVQIIPHIGTDTAEARITIENLSNTRRTISVLSRVLEKKSGRQISESYTPPLTIDPLTEMTVSLHVPINNVTLWSPENPFLYIMDLTLSCDDSATDDMQVSFGMREFRIKGGDFLLNGKKIYLRGSNIAFHRFLSDSERGNLPWNEKWIKRILIDIPKEHHFNFFRNHLGQMYNRWYDIADEYGMLLQNEWQFWGVTGTEEQITNEFTQWLRDNWNHPSIVIWDALNESRDETVEKKIIPQMKKVDPTRPWEPVDFLEDHPYIYSLGPVMNERAFGFTRALKEIERLPVPSVVNEFLWWWLDNEDNPTSLTKRCIERWLGTSYSKEELIERQSFLAQELVELFRRMKVDAVQPFVYLSNNNGPTAHWFLKPLEQLKPKPVLHALKNAFSPFGISIELWDRHFYTGEKRTVNIFIFNDTREVQNGVIRFGVIDKMGNMVNSREKAVTVSATDLHIEEVQFIFPMEEGTYTVTAQLHREDIDVPIAVSRKTAHVFSRIEPEVDIADITVSVIEDAEGELMEFFEGMNTRCLELSENSLHESAVLIASHGMLKDTRYQNNAGRISRFVAEGGTLVVIEPEFDVVENAEYTITEDVSITVQRREDKDEGGYDSYLFAEDTAHPLWERIGKEHLKMFNGGYGGEIVSQHTVVPSIDYTVHARCGMGLQVAAVMEIPYVSGTILISRLQVRERLQKSERPEGLFSRRLDPVLQRFMYNLVRVYAGKKIVSSAS